MAHGTGNYICVTYNKSSVRTIKRSGLFEYFTHYRNKLKRIYGNKTMT